MKFLPDKLSDLPLVKLSLGSTSISGHEVVGLVRCLPRLKTIDLAMSEIHGGSYNSRFLVKITDALGFHGSIESINLADNKRIGLWTQRSPYDGSFKKFIAEVGCKCKASPLVLYP